MSKLIVISGIDGSGKSTQINLLANKLKNLGFSNSKIWTRGGYTPLFSYLKLVLRFFVGSQNIPSGKSKKRSKILNNFFMGNLWVNLAIIDLIIFWSIYLRIKMLFFDFILCDRYLLDTFIDFKINFSRIKLNKNFLWILLCNTIVQPDLAFMLILPFLESQKRLSYKKEPFPDEYEVAQYRYFLYSENISDFNYENINANLSSNLVQENIIKQVFKKNIHI